MKQKSFLGLAPFVCAATTAALGCGASHGEDWARDGGGLHNDAGQLVNDAGQTINDAGQVINDAGQVINDAGQPIDTGTPGNEDSGAGGSTDSGGTGTVDSGGGPTGAAITCSNPGTYTMNGGACGTERWDIKTGTDPYTGMVSLVPQPNTIATLAGLPAAGGGTMRESPTEVTLWELKDVTLTELKLESDSDEHLVVSDGTNTMLVEVPYPTCATGSPWLCFITHVRSEIDAKYTVSSSPQYPAATVTLRGVGFFDYKHGQTGVAPNAIELHPALQICFGQGCTPS